jgi:hypothetical protein
MNLPQRVVLAIGLAAFLGLALFPPCIMSSTFTGNQWRPDGHRFIFSLGTTTWSQTPFGGSRYLDSYAVDYARLGLMFGIVIVATGAALVLFKGGRPEPRS